MDYEHVKKRMNEEIDRLSSLPVELIHKILSFIRIKDAINTSCLSSRWRFIWTSMPYLNLSDDDFNTKFITDVLSHRNSETKVYSLNIYPKYFENVSEAILKIILNYAISHNVQQLTISCLGYENIDFPFYLLHSESLKYLRLSGVPEYVGEFSFRPTWELPSLTTLHLDHVTFYDDKNNNGISILSKCTNLKSLTLNDYGMSGSNSLTICHPQLSNLTLISGHWSLNVVNVVAPQLENLCVKKGFGKYLISTPNLVSLIFGSHQPLLFILDDLCSLKKVDLRIYPDNAHKLVGLLQRFHNVKFLKLNLELVEFLSSCMEVIPLQPPPFANLKSLKIYPICVSEQAKEKVNVSTIVKNYLLDGSPSATLTMVSREEVRAFRNAVSAQQLMAELRVMLDRVKANTETNKAHTMDIHETKLLEQKKAQQPVEKMQLHVEEKMTQTKSCWEDVGVQIDQGREKTCRIISKLREIEVLLVKELPASRKDKLQARFSSLHAEANSFVNEIIDCMKIYQRRLNDCFNELATKAQLSS